MKSWRHHGKEYCPKECVLCASFQREIVLAAIGEGANFTITDYIDGTHCVGVKRIH